MPIKPENKHRYPINWPLIRVAVRARSGDRCEGSPAFPFCAAVNGKSHPDTGSKVVLTVAHLDHMPENCDGMEDGGKLLPIEGSNLRHWCQRCHLKYDAKHHAETAYATKRARRAIRDFFDSHDHILLEAIGGIVFIGSFLTFTIGLPAWVMS